MTEFPGMTPSKRKMACRLLDTLRKECPDGMAAMAAVFAATWLLIDYGGNGKLSSKTLNAAVKVIMSEWSEGAKTVQRLAAGKGIEILTVEEEAPNRSTES